MPPSDRRQRFRDEWGQRPILVTILVVLAILAVAGVAMGITALVGAQGKPTVEAVFGHNPTALVNPQAGVPGGEFSPTPDDVFAPPNSNAETYPGFPPGTRFLPGRVTDKLTLTSLAIANRRWNAFGLHSHCPHGEHVVHRYIDPDKQTLARSTINGCDIFIDKDTRIPPYRKSWAAMGYCNLIVHEDGHNYGIQHSPNPQRVMYYLGNSRAKTGCEMFAPERFGTVPEPATPSGILCAGTKATRYWLGDDPAKAFKLAQAHFGKPCAKGH